MSQRALICATVGNPSALNDRVCVHVCVTDLEQFSLAVGQLEQQLQQVEGERADRV